MGDPDLSSEGENRGSPLADAIRAGNGDAVAWFQEARLPRVQAYVAHVCPPELAEETVSAAFVDFLARTAARGVPDEQLDGVLLAATRSAAAGRFAVTPPSGGMQRAVSVECQAMPELLALHANHERPADERLIGGHLGDCPICAHSLARMQDAERAFAEPSGELPALDVQPTVVATRREASKTQSKVEPENGVETTPPPAVPLQPSPEPPAVPPPTSGTPRSSPAVLRRRSGGMVGAIRRLGRTIRE